MDKKLTISAEGKTDIERLVLTIHIGLLTLLKEKVISIDEAHDYLFSPYSAEYLKLLEVNDAIVDFIWRECELENVESLMPEKLLTIMEKHQKEVIEIFKKLPKDNLSTKKWIDWEE